MLPVNNISTKLVGKGPLKTIKSQKDISSDHSLLLLAHLSSVDSLLLPKPLRLNLVLFQVEIIIVSIPEGLGANPQQELIGIITTSYQVLPTCQALGIILLNSSTSPSLNSSKKITFLFLREYKVSLREVRLLALGHTTNK